MPPTREDVRQYLSIVGDGATKEGFKYWYENRGAAPGVLTNESASPEVNITKQVLGTVANAPAIAYNKIAGLMGSPDARESDEMAADIEREPWGTIATDLAANAAGIFTGYGGRLAAKTLIPKIASEGARRFSKFAAPYLENSVLFPAGYAAVQEASEEAGITDKELGAGDYALMGGIGAAGTTAAQLASVGKNLKTGGGVGPGLNVSEKQAAVATDPGSVTTRITGAPATGSPKNLELSQAAFREVPGYTSPEAFAVKSKFLENAEGTFDPVLGEFRPFDAEGRPVASGTLEELKKNPQALNARASAMKAQGKLTSSQRDTNLDTIDYDTKIYNDRMVAAGTPNMQVPGLSWRMIELSNSYKALMAEREALAGVPYGKFRAEAIDRAIADLRASHDALSLKNPTFTAQPDVPGAVLPGVTPKQMVELRQLIQNELRKGGRYNISPRADEVVSPSKLAAMKARTQGAQDVADMLKEVLHEQLDHLADPTAFHGGITREMSVAELKNLDSAAHSAIVLGQQLEDYMAEPLIAARVANNANLMNRQSAAVRVNTNMGVSASLSSAAEATKHLLVGDAPLATAPAQFAAKEQILSQFNEAMKLSGARRLIEAEQARLGKTLSIDERMDILSQYGFVRHTPSDAYTGLVPILQGAGQATVSLVKDSWGVPLAMNPLSGTPLEPRRSDVNKHNSIPRHIVGVMNTPPEFKYGALQMLAGPVDGPSLIHQEMNLRQPAEKAKFWTQVSRQFPEYPFEAGEITGLPSEFDAGDGPKLYDPQDVKAWADTIYTSNLREDIKAQLTAALFRDGTIMPLQEAGSLNKLVPPVAQARGLMDSMLDTVVRGVDGSKKDLIN